MAAPDRICVAQIGAAHGLKGEVRLKPFTEDAGALASFGTLTDETGSRAFKLLSARPSKDMLVVRLEGVNTREAAEALRHLRLYVERSRLPPTEDEEEFYHADLIGLAAIGPDGGSLGTVSALYDYGAGDMIEITGPDNDTKLYPFTREVVPAIDIDGGRIEIVPPDDDEVEVGDEAEEAAEDGESR